jgi:hypothetical protein
VKSYDNSKWLAQQQLDYMAAYNAQAQQAMNVSVLFVLNMGIYLSYN